MRNFAGLPVDGYLFRRIWDVSRLANVAYYKSTKNISELFLNTFCDLGLNNVDMLHFMNAVPITSKPFFVTFEKSLPRIGENKDWIKQYLVKKLAEDNCKNLIAFSDFAAQMQLGHLQTHYKGLFEEIAPKVVVMHPAQALHTKSYEEKTLAAEHLVFSMVGNDFFRKGGNAVLTVFERLIKAKQPVFLNIVSTLTYNDYATQTTKSDYDWAKSIISKYPKHIKHQEKLPNEQVINLLKTTHIALLPTYAETYGYSVLEAQACGCPVITTDIESLPEINNDQTGWVINLPKDRLGYSLHETAQQREALYETVACQLEAIITEILGNLGSIGTKSNQSILKIQNQNSIQNTSLKLTDLYNNALL